MSELFWDRTYYLEIGDDAERLIIDGNVDQPAEINFNVSIVPGGEMKFATITIYGLSRENRRRIYDRYTSVLLEAGWGGENYVIFSGTLYNVAVGRDGPESFVTLFCRSVGRAWEDAYVNQAFGPGTPAKELIQAVGESFGFPVEFVGDFSDLPPLTLGITVSRDPKLMMRDLAKNYNFWWIIEEGTLTVTRLDAKRPDSLTTISAETGMVGTPRITQRGIDVTSKMRPRIRPFDEIEVVNETSELAFANPTAASYQDTLGAGVYQVLGVTHVGSYSGNTWDTVLECLNPRSAQLQRIQAR